MDVVVLVCCGCFPPIISNSFLFRTTCTLDAINGGCSSIAANCLSMLEASEGSRCDDFVALNPTVDGDRYVDGMCR